MIATSLLCMSLAIHIEARGESKEGQIAVASVIMNRVTKKNSDICTEINKPYQFPWAKNKFQKVGDDYVISEKAIPTGEIWQRSVTLATQVLDGTQKLVPKVTHFHNVREFPNWFKLTFAYQIGDHKFYYG